MMETFAQQIHAILLLVAKTYLILYHAMMEIIVQQVMYALQEFA